jgi:hypothetical protein
MSISKFDFDSFILQHSQLGIPEKLFSIFFISKAVQKFWIKGHDMSMPNMININMSMFIMMFSGWWIKSWTAICFHLKPFLRLLSLRCRSNHLPVKYTVHFISEYPIFEFIDYSLMIVGRFKLFKHVVLGWLAPESKYGIMHCKSPAARPPWTPPELGSDVALHQARQDKTSQAYFSTA